MFDSDENMFDSFDSATDVVESLRSSKISFEETMSFLRDNFDKSESKIQAFLDIDWEVEPGVNANEKTASPNPSATTLGGIPIAVKDNICVRDSITTAGSKILETFVSPYDATVIRKLKAAGACIFGKTNLDEFGMGSSTSNSAFQVTSNPLDVSRVPGGSSGGSAAAVAAGSAFWSLGSDTGGSIRQPASFCGLTGLKPTFGRVSRYGLIAFASSLEQIGPICRSARDAALLLNIIAGHDVKDSTSSRQPVPDYVADLNTQTNSLKIGILSEQFDGLPSQIVAGLEEGIRQFEKLGHEVRRVENESGSLSNWQEQLVSTYYIVACCEASSNLSRYDGIRYTRRASAETLEATYRQTRSQYLGAEVKRRILLGTFALSSGYADQYYFNASRMRRLIKQNIDRQFSEFDLLLGPTTPTTAYSQSESNRPPVEIYRGDVFTVTANLTGIPAISIPCGFDENGLPIGMQLMAPHFCESRLLQTAYQFQTATDWHLGRPR